MATLFLTNKRSMALVPDSLQIQVWAKHWSKQKIFLYYSRSKRQSTFIRNLIRVFQQLDTAFRYIYASEAISARVSESADSRQSTKQNEYI